jgi:hypothetical protein
MGVSGQASRPGRAFTPGERTPGTHWTGGWVSPRAGLDTEAIGKILCPCRGSNPDRPVVQPVVRHYTAWANPAPTDSCLHILIFIKIGPKVTDHLWSPKRVSGAEVTTWAIPFRWVPAWEISLALRSAVCFWQERHVVMLWVHLRTSILSNRPCHLSFIPPKLFWYLITNDDAHFDVVRLRLWTAATKRTYCSSPW